MYRILRQHQSPPGAYDYQQTEGIARRFADDGNGLLQLAKNLRDFRIANQLPRPALGECLVDIQQHVCARLLALGNKTFHAHCQDVDETYAAAAANAEPRASRGCSGCGAHVS